MVAIYLDGADPVQMHTFHERVSGYTTNPSLMRKCGIANYKEFATVALAAAGSKPISFEVFSDDHAEMISQAREIASWGDNIYVKIPVTNTQGTTTELLCRGLSQDGIKLNITAVMTFDQIRSAARWLSPQTPAILSIFCGRIADTGRDPVPFIAEASRVKHDKTKILWASTRELLNLKQAEQSGADIITVTPDILNKMHLIGKDLAQYSLETVTQFYNDAKGIAL